MSEIYLTSQSGNKIDLIDTDLNEYKIEDIATGLSRMWRWAGQLDKFYSVAQHCVEVAAFLRRGGYTKSLVFSALMHDAAEAYILDLPRPIKRICPEFERLEDRLMQSISNYFKFQYPMDNIVKAADDVVLVTEHRDLRKKSTMDFENFKGIEPMDKTIYPLSSEVAYDMFLSNFREFVPTEYKMAS